MYRSLYTIPYFNEYQHSTTVHLNAFKIDAMFNVEKVWKLMRKSSENVGTCRQTTSSRI